MMSLTSIPFFDQCLPFNLKFLYDVLRNATERVNLFQAFALILLSLYFLHTLHLVFIHPLRNVPGPRLAKCSQIWRNYRYFRGTWHSDLLKLHRQYGPVVRVAPNEISFVDEAALKSLYGHGKQSQKARAPPASPCWDIG